MCWLAVDVVEAAGVAVAVAAAACAVVAAREGVAVCAAAVVIAEVVALAADTAALDAHLQCPARLLAHRPSIDRQGAAQALGRATVICRRLAAGPGQVLETGRVVVWPEVDQGAPVDPARVGLALVGPAQLGPAQVLARVPVVVPVVDHLPAVADFHRIAICKTSSIFHPVAALVAQIGHRLDLAARVELLPAARWQEARPLHSCRTVRAEAEDSATEDVQVAATSHRLCPHGPAADLMPAAPDNLGIGRVTSVALVNQVIDRVTSAALANQAIVPATLVNPGDPEIDQATLGDQADPATGPGISVDPGDPATGPAISADPDVPVIDPEILVGRAGREVTLLRTCRVASLIARDGRIGATNIATTLAIGGRTTRATSTIGSTTIGGTTLMLTGRTIRASATGAGPRGMGSRTGWITAGLIPCITTTVKTFTTMMAPYTTATSRSPRMRSTPSKPKRLC
jgi:hypothetical protein